MPAAIIDTHTHVISPDRSRYPTAPLGGTQSDWSTQRPIPVEGLLAAMDEAGVSKAVVVQASSAYGHDNACVADSVERHRDRLAGVCSVDILAEDAVEQIRHWHGRGLAGFRLFTTGTTMPGQAGWIDDPRGFAAWALAQDLRLPIAIPLARSGQLRMLAVTAEERWPELPDVPTLAEAGYPQASNTIIYGLYGPAGLPSALVERINAGLSEWVARPATRQAILAQGLVPTGGPQPDFQATVHAELRRWAQVVRDAGIRPD